ncbi:PEP-utilizing enzyme [Paraliobacillus sp. JSM ZJ581]|uniref:PEP-utilizing enzyme n=1 Tax=Paraliobacillus sp. JSM ZJ581 TaxID=3342118 RepID=UPI0035A82861
MLNSTELKTISTGFEKINEKKAHYEKIYKVITNFPDKKSNFYILLGFNCNNETSICKLINPNSKEVMTDKLNSKIIEIVNKYNEDSSSRLKCELGLFDGEIEVLKTILNYDIDNIYLTDCSYVGKESEFDNWTRGNVAEAFPHVLTPLSWSLWGNVVNDLLKGTFRFYSFFKESQEYSFIKLKNGLLYYNIGVVNHFINKVGSVNLDEVVGGDTAGTGRGKSAEKISILRLLLNYKQVKKGKKHYDSLKESSLKKWEEFSLKNIDWKQNNYAEMTLEQLGSTVSSLINYGRKNMYLHTDATSSVFTKTAILRWKLKKKGLDNQDELLSELENIKGIEIAELKEVIKEIVHSIKESDEREIIIDCLSSDNWIEKLNHNNLNRYAELIKAKLIDRFGHRGSNELEVMERTWGEDPSLLLNFIVDRYYTDWKDVTIQEKTLSKKLKPYRNLIQEIKDMTILRENNKHYLYYIISEVKKIFREIEIRFNSKGYTRNRDDLYYLSYSEVTKIIDKKIIPDNLIDLVQERKMLFYGYNSLKNQSKKQTNKIIEKKILGMIACQGYVKGTARIVHDINNVKDVNKEDILVVKTMDISWSPIFSKVKGVVTEIGGLLSHAAIVAREYNIPTLVNVKDATTVLKDGDKIILDAKEGNILLDYD